MGNDRSNNFDAVRILASIAVIYGHAHPLAATHDPVVMGNSVQALAVKIFFVISGYLVARSWIFDPSPGRYLAKRALRIFPALILLLLLTALVLGPLLTNLSVRDYFANLGVWRYLYLNAVLYPVYGLADLFSGNVYPSAVNGSLWSLPVEFLMYLVFPVVFMVSRVDGTNRLFWLFVICLCGLSIHQLRIGNEVTHAVLYGTSMASVLDVAPFFFLGALYSVTSLGRCLKPEYSLYVIAALALLQPTSAAGKEVALYLVLPYCILSLCVSDTAILRSFGKFGDPSYGIYLYGFVVQQTIYALAEKGMTPLSNTLISVPIAVALAYGSWHLLEKRALSFKPRGGS